MSIHKIKTYILVHGAWHGSWCWSKLIPYLQEKGHKVMTPSLPGHDDKRVNFKDITLQNYVNHIQNLIDLSSEPVILVGHSMAGLVITQVAENRPEKIRQLIYIAAFIPDPGKSLIDEEKKALVARLSLEVSINALDYAISLPFNFPKRICELFYEHCCEEDIHFALSHLQLQPLKPFLDSVSFSYKKLDSVPKIYIECLQDKAIDLQDQRRMHHKIKCEVKSIDTDHSPFFSNPHQLADLLCSDRIK